MQEIVDYYTIMHENTGGKLQKYKVMMCGWKCKNDQIVEGPMSITINEENIRMTNVKSIKALGVCISHSLRLKDEHEDAKKDEKFD